MNRLRMEEGSRAAADLSHLRNRPKIESQMFAVSCKHHQVSKIDACKYRR